MALSTKTYTSTKTSRNYSIRLTLTEDSTSVTDNTSSITYKLELLSEDWNFSQYACGYSVTVNGVQVAYLARASAPQISISKNSSFTLCTGTTTVTHNSDGTKTISASNISASIDMPLAGAGPGAISLTADSDWTLTTIARKSTLSITNGTLGTAKSMTVTTQSSGFTHTLTYTCGSASGTIATKQAASAITTYTFPITLAAQNTTGASVTVGLTLTTYSGSTNIGSNTYSISMTIPDNSTTKPTIGTITTGEPSGQSHISTYGGYIQNNSRMTVSFSPSGYKGATITSSSIKIGTMYTYSGTSATSGVLTASGSVTITVSVTDSRGFVNSGTKSVTIKAYSAPSISNVGLTRTDANGNALETGAYGTITFKATGTNISGNTITYKAYYKASTASSYSNVTLSSYNNNYNVTAGKYTFSAATTSSWYAYITAADKFNTTTSSVVYMSSGAAFLKFEPNYNCLSIGKIETKTNRFCIALATEFDSNIYINNDANIYNLKAAKDQWYTTNNAWGLNMNNSDIIGANGIYFADACDSTYNEGIHFKRSSGDNYDTLYGINSHLYWMVNHSRTANSSNVYEVLTKQDVNDYIVATGNGTNFKWVHTNRGLSEYYGEREMSITQWNAWGNLYESQEYVQFWYGSGVFKEWTRPLISVSVYGTIGTCGTDNYCTTGTYYDRSPQIHALRPNNSATGSVRVCIHAFGVWESGVNYAKPINSMTNRGLTIDTRWLTGYTYISGTCTASGGRTVICSDSFDLAAGTYSITLGSTGTNACDSGHVNNASGGANLVTVYKNATASFTLSSATTCTVGCNFTNGTTYEGYVIFTINKTA